mmetsp:Transcript_104952/g.306572  ORF Transcript_104952/g.306572 Transcript_104952/m.306572 type:complete len:296 (+) Transcript_104952:946-1833(+)
MDLQDGSPHGLTVLVCSHRGRCTALRRSLLPWQYVAALKDERPICTSGPPPQRQKVSRHRDRPLRLPAGALGGATAVAGVYVHSTHFTERLTSAIRSRTRRVCNNIGPLRHLGECSCGGVCHRDANSRRTVFPIACVSWERRHLARLIHPATLLQRQLHSPGHWLWAGQDPGSLLWPRLPGDCSKSLTQACPEPLHTVAILRQAPIGNAEKGLKVLLPRKEGPVHGQGHLEPKGQSAELHHHAPPAQADAALSEARLSRNLQDALRSLDVGALGMEDKGLQQEAGKRPSQGICPC